MNLRLVAGFLVVAALATALVYALAWEPQPTPDAPSSSPGTVGVSSGASPTTEDAVDGAARERDAVLAGAQRALDAWGEFAVTGDPGVLGDVFADGPQLEQLRREAEAMGEPLGPPPYVFTLDSGAVVLVDAEEATVTTDLTMTRPGEPAQTFRWRLHLRRVGDQWRLWTVENLG